jgi:membrane AbrB-like protein
MVQTFGTAAAALLAGLAGGSVFYVLHLPLPWTLGSLLAAAIISIVNERWSMPVAARELARPVVGVFAGSAFTPAILSSAAEWWDAVLIVAGFGVVTTLVGNIYFRKVGGFDRVTAFFSSTPGGLSEMTLLTQRH